MSERTATTLITADTFLRMPENRGAERMGGRIVPKHRSLDGREILPGFTLSLAELFKGLEG